VKKDVSGNPVQRRVLLAPIAQVDGEVEVEQELEER